jgi:hypothetical protein
MIHSGLRRFGITPFGFQISGDFRRHFLGVYVGYYFRDDFSDLGDFRLFFVLCLFVNAFVTTQYPPKKGKKI